IPHDSDGENRRHDELCAAEACPGIGQLAEHEEEDEREQVVKKENRAFSHRDTQIRDQQCEVGLHSFSSPARRSPVTLRNTSSSVGREMEMSSNSFASLST